MFLIGMMKAQIFFSGVFLHVNPEEQIAEANNADRSANVSSLLNATWMYHLDNGGEFPGEIDLTTKEIGSDKGMVDVCEGLVPTYLAYMPYDPVHKSAYYIDCNDYRTGYFVSKDIDGRITIDAPYADLGMTISVTR